MDARKLDPDSLPAEITIPASDRKTRTKARNARPKKKRSVASGKTKSKALLLREQQELVDIKNALGLRHQDFAVVLNIGLPRLSSYLYGRTASVPPEIMKTARQFLAENRKMSTRLRRKFSAPMSEILDGWAKKLKTRSDTQLAALLGVVGMTLSRWKKNETRPDLSALNRYDQIVELVARSFRA